MRVAIDTDPLRSASHRSMVDHLIAPLGPGAVDTPAPISATGVVAIPWITREPLVLLAPRRSLGADAIRIKIEILAPVASSTTVEFAAYTEAGAFVPLWWLDPAVVDRTVDSIRLRLRVTSRPKIDAPDLTDWFELRVVEGVIGKTIYLLGAEAARLRRQGRENAAMRVLDEARDDALDRIGAELGVPRLADRLVFKNNALQTETSREADTDYRRRLRIYRSRFLRSVPAVTELLNGPGNAGDPNRGPIGELAGAVPAADRASYRKRFDIVERDNEFAIGISIVAGGDPIRRSRFFEVIRATRLVWPGGTAAANAAHARRFLPSKLAARDQRLRAQLRTALDLGSVVAGPEPALAPMLAQVLLRAARCIRVLGGPSPWSIFQAQHPDHGSRYELGLGVDAKQLTAAQLTAMAAAYAALAAADPEFEQIADPDPGDSSAIKETQAALKAMSPVSPAADPDGRWLFEACGLRTVHRVPQSGAPWSIVYLSHFPTFGVTVTPPASSLEPGGWGLAVSGRFAAAGAQFGSSEIFAYEIEKGAAAIWSTGWGSPLTAVGSQTDLRTSFTHLAAGRFTPATTDQLLLYDPVAGELELRARDRVAVTTPLGVTQNVRKTWSHVVAFGVGELARVLLYDRTAGAARVYSASVQAKLLPVGAEQSGLGGSWTHIVALDTAPGYSDLFFYDAKAGEGVVFEVDGDGVLTRKGLRHAGLGSWTHVVPGYYGGNTRRQGVCFYDRLTGRSRLVDGDLARLSETRLGAGWALVVPLQVGTTELTHLYLYDRLRGRGELWGHTGYGTLARVVAQGNLPGAIAHEVAARYHASGDPGSNVVLTDGVRAAAARWQALGRPAWSMLTDNQARARWNAATARAATDPALDTFREAGLPAIEDPVPLVRKLKAIAPELIDTLTLDQAQSQAIIAHTAGSADDLRDLIGLLESERIVSALPLVTGPTEVVLIVAVTPLPVAGANLYEEISSGFRWYVVPIDGDGGRVRATGSRTALELDGTGLSAVVALGYARRGLTDPYEFRVDLPPDGLLTVGQYEFLMNLLEHVYPVGVRVNTYSIRRRHVDLRLSGAPSTLDPTTSRTYRAFRRRRHRGETSVTLPDE